jgi:hypothetical protein
MCLFLLRTQTNMSNIIAGNGGSGRGCTATAITVALILMVVSSPAILATTEAFAAPLSKKDCRDIQFRTFEDSFASKYSGRTVTIGTSQHEYSVKIDYFKVEDDFLGYVLYKNVGAKDPKGRVLLPGGETITITLQTQEGVSSVGGHIFLYEHKVSDCQILLGHVKDSDKIDLKIVSAEYSFETDIAKITVQVPDASDVVGKHFTKLGVLFELNPEVREYHLISHRVQVSS